MEKDANCIFCKIIDRQIPGKIVREEDDYIAIADINPQAPVHLLVIPKDHVRNVAVADNPANMGRWFTVAANLGKEHGGHQGFRLVVNTGPNGGQTVEHVHIHVLAGRFMTWPPG